MPGPAGRSKLPGNSTTYRPIHLQAMSKPALLQPGQKMGSQRPKGSAVKGKKMPGWEKDKFHLGEKGYTRGPG